jgi:hypothetical protein
MFEVYDKNTDETVHTFKSAQAAMECCDDLNEQHDDDTPLYGVRENVGKEDKAAGHRDFYA